MPCAASCCRPDQLTVTGRSQRVLKWTVIPSGRPQSVAQTEIDPRLEVNSFKPPRCFHEPVFKSSDRWEDKLHHLQTTRDLCVHFANRLGTRNSRRVLHVMKASPPVARKRWATSSSWGEIFTFDSLSCLKAEKSLLFLLCATFFLLRLSAGKWNTQQTSYLCTTLTLFLSTSSYVKSRLYKRLKHFEHIKPINR